jgi:Tfp pilus assembly protein PilX
MRHFERPTRVQQRGVTLAIALIMLFMLTIIVVGAMTLGLTNLKIVGNVQQRNEAIAAANSAIEQILSTSFMSAPLATTITIDTNQDGSVDYTVNVATPTCIARRPEINVNRCLPSAQYLTGVSFGGGASASCYENRWEITATAQSASSAAQASAVQGVSIYSFTPCS